MSRLTCACQRSSLLTALSISLSLCVAASSAYADDFRLQFATSQDTSEVSIRPAGENFILAAQSVPPFTSSTLTTTPPSLLMVKTSDHRTAAGRSNSSSSARNVRSQSPFKVDAATIARDLRARLTVIKPQAVVGAFSTGVHATHAELAVHARTTSWQ